MSPEPLYDDVVELMADQRGAPRWGVAERRATAGALGVVSAAALLLTLVRAPHHGLLVPVLIVAGAALLLVGGAALSRAAGDLAAGGLAGAIAVPYAAVGAASFLSGSPGRFSVLLGAAAALLVCALIPAFVGGLEPVAAGCAVLALFTGLGALIVVLADSSTGQAAAVMAPLALAATTLLPTAALRLSRLPRPQLALNAADLAELPAEIDLRRTQARVTAARSLLSGLSAGCFAVTAAGAGILMTDRDGWARALATVLLALVLLRARLFVLRSQVLLPVVAVIAATVAVLLVLVFDVSRRLLLPVLAPTAAGLTIVCLVAGASAGRVAASPRQRRLVDIAEALLLVAVTPLALGVWHVYSTLFGLRS